MVVAYIALTSCLLVASHGLRSASLSLVLLPCARWFALHRWRVVFMLPLALFAHRACMLRRCGCGQPHSSLYCSHGFVGLLGCTGVGCLVHCSGCALTCCIALALISFTLVCIAVLRSWIVLHRLRVHAACRIVHASGLLVVSRGFGMASFPFVLLSCICWFASHLWRVVLRLSCALLSHRIAHACRLAVALFTIFVACIAVLRSLGCFASPACCALVAFRIVPASCSLVASR